MFPSTPELSPSRREDDVGTLHSLRVSSNVPSLDNMAVVFAWNAWSSARVVSTWRFRFALAVASSGPAGSGSLLRSPGINIPSDGASASPVVVAAVACCASPVLVLAPLMPAHVQTDIVLARRAMRPGLPEVSVLPLPAGRPSIPKPSMRTLSSSSPSRRMLPEPRVVLVPQISDRRGGVSGSEDAAGALRHAPIQRPAHMTQTSSYTRQTSVQEELVLLRGLQPWWDGSQHELTLSSESSCSMRSSSVH